MGLLESDIKCSKHAEARMVEREIWYSDILNVLNKGQDFIPNEILKKRLLVKYGRGTRTRFLGNLYIIYNDYKRPVNIITVYFKYNEHNQNQTTKCQ